MSVWSNQRPGRVHQCIHNKPTKLLGHDPFGYTLDFNLYCGKQQTTPLSAHGLTCCSHGTCQTIPQPRLPYFFDNFYTSPKLFNDLGAVGIGTTGTPCMS